MSSANAVELILVPEAAYGQTPAPDVAAAQAIRFTTETLSGTPTTVASTENRTDRMSGGQIVTGLTVGGAINGELSPDLAYQYLFQLGMMSAPLPELAQPAGAITLTKDATNPQLATLALAGAAFQSDYAVGDMLMLSGFPTEANNGPAQITAITDETHLQAAVKTQAVDEVSTASGLVTRPASLAIGSQVFSATFSKAYTDVTHLASSDEHSQRYSGGIVNGFEVTLTYGAIVTCVFNLLANGYLQEAPSLAQQIEAAGGAVLGAGTGQQLNASIDMGLVTVDGQPTAYCIESMKIALVNGNTPQNCLGRPAPTRYNAGTAAITVDASIYLADGAYDAFMPAKLDATPIGMLFAAGNDDGGYAFRLPAVQLSFPDPAATGQNAQVMIAATGQAKVGPPADPSALTVYYWGAPPPTPMPPATLAALTGTFTLPDTAGQGDIAGAILGKRSGSSLTLTDDAGGMVALSGTNVVRGAAPLDFASAPTPPFTLRETLASASNSPRDTTLTLFVTSTSSPLAMPAIAPTATQTTYPIELSADLALVPSTDQLQVVVSPNLDMSSPLFTSAWVATGNGGALVFPGLEAITASAGEVFVALRRNSGGTIGPYGNVLKWGDTTPPVASGGGSVTLNEHLHVAIPVSFSEPVYPALAGTNGGSFEFAGMQPGSSFMVRLVGDGLTDYETAPSLSATVSGTDLGGNVSNSVAIDVTIINDPSDDPPYDYTQYAAGYEIKVAGAVFQDTAGTVPATAQGDPVRRVNDLSGHGNHLTMPTGGDHWILNLDATGVLKWLTPNSPASRLSNTALQLYTGSVWQRMSALMINVASVSARLFHSGDGVSTGLLYEMDAANLGTYDGAAPSTECPVSVGVNHTILENHGSGASWLAADGATPPAGGWAGNTTVNGLTLGNHAADTGPGSQTPDFRIYAFAIANNVTFGPTEAALRAHLETLFA
jgi:hypothetical protein